VATVRAFRDAGRHAARPWPRVSRWLGAAAALGLLAAPVALGAQAGPPVQGPQESGWVAPGGAPGILPMAPAEVQDELQRAAERFARAWSEGQFDEVTALLSGRGIRLRLEELDRSALSTRQAAAALRDFLRGFEGGEVTVVRAAPVAGSPGRGFAELSWLTRIVGTSDVLTRSVFLGMSLEGSGWRVDELRLLP
jgi:hypothetical protein